MDALKLGTSHPVLPPIPDDDPLTPKEDFTNDANSFHKLIKTQQLPPENFVGIRKIKNLSSARKVTSNKGEPNSRVLVKEDASRKGH